jgi:catechol 2,3-dioxygenase-like lactoylglutathione lyase family enzyme
LPSPPGFAHVLPARGRRDREDAMFSHVMIGTNDLEKSKTFYDAVLGTLGVKPGFVDGNRVFWRTKTGTFGVSIPINGEKACFANGGTIGFAVETPEQADAWHAAGVANGGTSIENPPGIRKGGMGEMYLAYLRDPDGNKICALKRMG